MEIENVAVFPVPDCAWAMTSRPFIIGFIDLCWMAEGFSKPVVWEKKYQIRFFHYGAAITVDAIVDRQFDK